jgi:hypothetical protein
MTGGVVTCFRWKNLNVFTITERNKQIIPIHVGEKGIFIGNRRSTSADIDASSVGRNF